METPNSFISRLYDIRANLKDALHANRGLASKFVGPKPEDPRNTPEQAMNSVDALLADIAQLSRDLVKLAEGHHMAVGCFDGPASAPGRALA